MAAFRAENHVGTVTSGTRSPLCVLLFPVLPPLPILHLAAALRPRRLKQNISMGYIRKGFTKSGRKLYVDVRGKSREAVVAKMPFVPAKYYKPQ